MQNEIRGVVRMGILKTRKNNTTAALRELFIEFYDKEPEVHANKMFYRVRTAVDLADISRRYEQSLDKDFSARTRWRSYIREFASDVP